MKKPKTEKILTKFNFTDKNSTSRIKYIVIHYVGACGGAKANCQYYASRYIGASAHYFVGFNGEICQSVEDGDIAWHCGASSYKHKECRNSNSIGIELCVRNKGSQSATSKDWYFEDATVKAAVELTRYLMEKYSVPDDNVIRHYDVTGKVCPNPYVYNKTDHTWDEFKKLVSGSDKEEKEPEATAEPEKQTSVFEPYTVVTTCDVLLIRQTPGGTITGRIEEKDRSKRDYTIVEEADGWGRLKSGAGWISLKYCKKTGRTLPALEPYTVVTTCDVLRIRIGAGTNTPVVGKISEKEGEKKEYTIVEEADGWGRLKSGAGWISLKYCKKTS